MCCPCCRCSCFRVVIVVSVVRVVSVARVVTSVRVIVIGVRGVLVDLR